MKTSRKPSARARCASAVALVGDGDEMGCPIGVVVQLRRKCAASELGSMVVPDCSPECRGWSWESVERRENRRRIGRIEHVEPRHPARRRSPRAELPARGSSRPCPKSTTSVKPSRLTRREVFRRSSDAAMSWGSSATRDDWRSSAERSGPRSSGGSRRQRPDAARWRGGSILLGSRGRCRLARGEGPWA